MNVFSNIAFPLQLRGIGGAEAAERVTAVAAARAPRGAGAAARGPALRRSAPAGGAGARDRVRAAHPAHGRAALGARQEASRVHADRDPAAPRAAGHDDRLCDARSARGADHVRSRRGHRPWPHSAARRRRERLYERPATSSSRTSSANPRSCRSSVESGVARLGGDRVDAGRAARLDAGEQFLLVRPEKLEVLPNGAARRLQSSSMGRCARSSIRATASCCYVDARAPASARLPCGIEPWRHDRSRTAAGDRRSHSA